MPLYISRRVIKLMVSKSIQAVGARILVLGMAFKEDCPDVRNSRVAGIASELESYGAHVDVYDPWVDKEDARREYGVELIDEPEQGAYDVIVIAVAHAQFKELGAEGIRAFGKSINVVYDVKYVLPAEASDDRL